MNDFESAAMWQLYGQDAGIAIQSTKARLVKGFDVEGSNVSIAPVTYFDYNMGDLSSIPVAEYGLPEHYKMMITPELCFKRRSFEHERELRILTWETDPDRKDLEYVSVNLEVLIEKVYVSPLSPDWVSEVVSREMSHYGSSPKRLCIPISTTDYQRQSGRPHDRNVPKTTLQLFG